MKKKNPDKPEKTPIDEIPDEDLDAVAGGKKATKKKATRSFKAGSDLSKADGTQGYTDEGRVTY